MNKIFRFSSIALFEKVKQLFTGSSKKKLENKQEKDKFMVREDEMRQRYKEYRPSKTVNSTTVRTFESREPKVRFL